MNDDLKKEPEPRDVIGWRKDGFIAYVFNVGRSDQFIRLYTVEEAEQIGSALHSCLEQLKRYLGVEYERNGNHPN